MPFPVFVITVWLAFLGMHGYYFLLDYWNTPHPSYLPLFFLIAVQGIALLSAICIGVWRLVRKPQRLKTAAWLSLGFLPVFLWYSQVSLTFHSVADRVSRQVEMSWYLVTTQPIGAALLDSVGRWTLPYKLEGERTVMFYDSAIADPQGDLEKMDAFIKNEEQYLGRTMLAKIHWMRAPLFGMPGYALASIAVARPGHFSGDETCVDSVDYHEAAHNIIPLLPASAVYAGHYPPSFLREGWAESRTTDWFMLAEESWKLKRSNKALTVCEMASDIYYNQSDYRIYQQGGALVTVLLDKFGPEKFLELYTNCTRKTFERDVERIYGLSLEELDMLYWEEVESLRRAMRAFEKTAENLTSEEKGVLEEFREENQSPSIPLVETVGRMTVKQRLHRHWAIAVCWLLVPLLVIFWHKTVQC